MPSQGELGKKRAGAKESSEKREKGAAYLKLGIKKGILFGRRKGYWNS